MKCSKFSPLLLHIALCLLTSIHLQKKRKASGIAERAKLSTKNWEFRKRIYSLKRVCDELGNDPSSSSGQSIDQRVRHSFPVKTELEKAKKKEEKRGMWEDRKWCKKRGVSSPGKCTGSGALTWKERDLTEIESEKKTHVRLCLCCNFYPNDIDIFDGVWYLGKFWLKRLEDGKFHFIFYQINEKII